MKNCPTNMTDHDKAVLNRIFNPQLPYGDDHVEQAVMPEEEETDIVKEAKSLEVEGVKAAERGDIEIALDFFTKAIQVAPTRSSGYNNRAQALRLTGDTEGALENLNRAIDLSNGTGRAMCQAYIQRGLISRLRGNDAKALEDFKRAAQLGGEFAKQLVVTLNPYAALCNQMLVEVIGKLQKGQE